MNLADCRDVLNSFAGRRVLVVGDLMLDEHIWGSAERISPEAPVLVVKADNPRSDFRAGGAANVAVNIRSLGAEASAVGIVGDDEGRELLIAALHNSGVDTTGVFTDPGRLTTRKTRVWASGRHQVVRIDRESGRAVSAEVIQRIVGFVLEAAAGFDAVLISDYDKGVVTQETASAVIRVARERGIPGISNAKPRNLMLCRGIDIISLNQSEASSASGIEIDEITDVERAGRTLMATADCRGLVITRGSRGLSVFCSPEEIYHIPPIETEVYDVAGAGDTVVSALTLALASGLDLRSAGIIANCAGAAVVRKVGVAAPSVEEILSLLTLCLEESPEPARGS